MGQKGKLQLLQWTSYLLIYQGDTPNINSKYCLTRVICESTEGVSLALSHTYTHTQKIWLKTSVEQTGPTGNAKVMGH